jgi:hypothetical protein
LLNVVDVVGPDGVFAIGQLEQLFGCDDHGLCFPAMRSGGTEAEKGTVPVAEY